MSFRKSNDLPYIEGEGENTYRAHLSTEGEVVAAPGVGSANLELG